jgi:hypothetical protein
MVDLLAAYSIRFDSFDEEATRSVNDLDRSDFFSRSCSASTLRKAMKNRSGG